MQPDHRPYLERWLAHVRHLAETIGPRGPTTADERRGSEYCRQTLSDLGLAARLEAFAGAWSIFRPHVFFALAMLIAFVVYPLAGRTSAGIAAGIAVLALTSELLELSFVTNPFRWLVRKGPSQNAVATLDPAGEHRQDLILVGHVDTQRTPIFFSTPRWVSIYQNFTTAAFVLFAAQVLLYLLGAIVQRPWIWWASIPCALCAVTMAAFFIHADRTPFTAGANDNATAAGLLLVLAEHLRAEPLQHTRVWFVCTGCEETQHYGAIDFYRRHRKALVRPISIVFELFGCDGPAWLTQEGIVVPFRADPALRTLAEQLAAEHPEWGVYPVQIKGGNTEMADALRAGVPAITLTGQGPQNEMPYWHQVGDTVDKLDPDVMERAYAFTWAFIRALDERA